MIAIRNEGKKINSAINVTPMVDVMLVLLIIFMVVTPMLQPGKLVEMARTRNPVDMSDANKADALIVSVLRDGKDFSWHRERHRRSTDAKVTRASEQPP